MYGSLCYLHLYNDWQTLAITSRRVPVRFAWRPVAGKSEKRRRVYARMRFRDNSKGVRDNGGGGGVRPQNRPGGSGETGTSGGAGGSPAKGTARHRPTPPRLIERTERRRRRSRPKFNVKSPPLRPAVVRVSLLAALRPTFPDRFVKNRRFFTSGKKSRAEHTANRSLTRFARSPRRAKSEIRFASRNFFREKQGQSNYYMTINIVKTSVNSTGRTLETPGLQCRLKGKATEACAPS